MDVVAAIEDDLFAYALMLGDSALVLSHRLSEWSGFGPTLEEDIALSNMALDLIGQARLCLDYAGKVEGRGRDEDALAYLRDDNDYRNLLICEQPRGDFAVTMVRQLFYAGFMQPCFASLMASRDSTLAAIAAKAEKEMAYHLRHAGEWVIRLGDGTAESHTRTQRALDEMAIYVAEFFTVSAVERRLADAGIAPDPLALRAPFENSITPILKEATLIVPSFAGGQYGGKNGRHGEHLSRLLGEMQGLHRAHPGATW